MTSRIRVPKNQNPFPDGPPKGPSTIGDEPSLSEEDKALIQKWRFDYYDAAKEIGRIEHRDLAGTVVPFDVNFAQKKQIDDIYRMLVLTLRMQYDAAKLGQEVAIPNLVYRMENGYAIYPYEVPLRLMIGKSRRRGMSALVEFIMFIRMNFLRNYPCVLMAHAEDSANQIGNYARDYWKRWPAKYRHLRFDTSLNAEGRLKLKNDSRLDVFTAGSKAAQENSRGWRFDFYHFSEYAHYSSYTEVQACAIVTPPHAWVIKESTGNGPSGPFHREWNGALSIDEAERAYNEKDYETLRAWDGVPNKHVFKSFFSWLDDPGLSAQVMEWETADFQMARLDDYERALVEKFPDKVTPQKLKWRRITLKDCQDHELQPEAYFAQEYPASEDEMFQATGSKVFAQYESLKICALRAENEPPLFKARCDGVTSPVINPLAAPNLFVYKLPEPGRFYLVGVDPKMGACDNKDEHAIVVLDQHDGTFFEEVACFFDRLLDGNSVGVIATMLAEMYNRAFITPEIQGGGLAIARTIVGDCGYSRVYERKSLDAIGGKSGGENYFRFGIYTLEQTKDAMAQDIRQLLRDGRLQLRTRKLIDQMFSYERVDKKYGAPEGELDDGVMGLQLCVFGGLLQGRPSRRGPSDAELARSIGMAADAMTPELADFTRMVAAKVARDIKKNMAKKNVRQKVDKKPAPVQK